MKRKTYRILVTTFLTVSILCSTLLTAWAAGPGENLAETESADGVSRVITVGVGQSTPVAETEASEEAEAPAAETGRRGASLGMFTTTGYCNCSKCSGGFNLTYSGTVPKARHTISADLNVFPIGTKVMIGDVVYTVEDMGSGVRGNWIDIFYGSHEEAVAHGMKTQEVFAVE